MAKSDKFTQDDINELKSIEGVNNIFGMNVTDDTNTYIHIDKSMFSIGNITSDEKESFDKLFVESSSKAFNTNIYGYDPYLIQRCENQFESTNITSNNELNALIYMNNASIRIKEGTVIGLDIGKGDIIPISCTLVTEGQPKTITLNAKVYGFLSGLPVSIGYYPAESPLVVVDRKELNKHLGLGETYSHIYINTDKSNRESVENSLRKLSQDKAWKFVSNHEERDKALKELWTMILAALAFIFIVFLIGMLNIYNTVNTNIILKLNEIGIIKAIGTSQKEILQIQTFEGAILGIIGSVISLIISTSVCFALSTMERTENIFSGIPWPVFIGIAILNIIICISVVYLCARKINKLNIMQSINYIN
jgi:ABC-type antimicrobial peptide transport system permease subunit